MADLVATRLYKAYGPTPVLRDVSLTVADGAFVTLLGPSGCGKTTVLRIVAGFAAPDRGTVTLGGRSLVGLPPERRAVGMVFQSYALFPHLDVVGNIAFGLRMHHVARAEQRRRIGEMLDLVRLTGLEHRRPAQLSGGQQQRVAIARALVTKPGLLLLDEPLSALDKQFRAEMQIELKTLQRTVGITTLFVTHDQEEALALSDIIAVMRDGRIEQAGTPGEVYGNPATPFVADFVGLSNVVEGVTVDAGASGLGLLRTARGVGLTFAPAGAAAPGSRVRASIRPERIALVDATDGEETANVYRGRVANVVFLGPVTHVFVETDLGHLRVLVITTPHTLPAAGQDVRVRIDPAGVTIYRL